MTKLNKHRVVDRVRFVTMGDLLDLVQADVELTPARRNELRSSIRRFLEITNSTPHLTADFPTVRRLVNRVSPGAAALSRKSWSNVRCNLRYLLERYQAPRRSPQVRDLSAAWRCLRAAPAEVRIRRGLSRFIHWCSREGIEPDDVDDRVFARYRVDLQTRSLTSRPDKLYRNACKLWNDAVERVPGWPRRKVALPSFRDVVSFPWSAFPPAFRQDLDRYLRVMGGHDLLSDSAPAKPRRQTTLRHHKAQIRLIASALVRSGVPMEALTGLAVLTSVENARRALSFHVERMGGLRPGIFEMASTLLVIAKQYIQVSAPTLTQL